MKIIIVITLALLICKISSDGLDDNLLKQMKNVALPILRTLDPVIYIRTATLISNGAFDAIAPYIETAKGVYSNIPKQPAAERTIRNKNIAIAYACLRILNNILPAYVNTWRNELINIGLDPDDYTMDVTTSIGIGNTAADNVLKVRSNDGMNQNGDVFQTQYNKERYENYIPYKPRNRPYKLEFPDYWQPSLDLTNFGIYQSQVHICPQYGKVKPYALSDVNSYVFPIPLKSKISNYDEYKNQTDEILDASYRLDDEKKMIAEFFSDKPFSLDVTMDRIIEKNNLDLDHYVWLQFAVKISLFDNGIIQWKEKIRHNAVRPFSTVRYLYGNKTIKAWGGRGVGTVENMKGVEWKPYLPTPPHTEYPSVSTCLCTAQGHILRKYFSTNDLNYSIKFVKGSSFIEPSITPSNDVIVNFNTYDDFINMCGLSRLYAGVHFLSSIEESKKHCKPIADAAYDFVKTHFYGTSKGCSTKSQLFSDL